MNDYKEALMNYRHLALTVAIAVACVIMSAAAFAGPAPETVSFRGAEKYESSDVVRPFESFESPLGITDSITIALPSTYDPESVQLAFLWLTVRDIDSKEEATISLNGQALAIPDELIGVGREIRGSIQLNASSLRPGPNELRLTLTDEVTASNKGGIVIGCSIESAAILLIRTGADTPGFDRYSTDGSAIPQLVGVPVGTKESVTMTIPSSYDLTEVSAAYLLLVADDIDSSKEAVISLNGHPLDIPADLIGEGTGWRGLVNLDPAFLRPGQNELGMVFADNLNGTTGGWGIMSASLLIPRPGMITPQPASTERDTYLTMIPDAGIAHVRDVSAEDTKVKMFRSKGLVWQEQPILKVAGKNKWTCRTGEFRFLKTLKRTQIAPCGLAQMDNGEVILLGEIVDGDRQRIAASFSKDNGDTWTDWNIIPKVNGEPAMLRYLGDGALCFDADVRWFSADYGRTWFDANSLRGRRWQARYSIPDSSEGSSVRAKNGWFVKAFCRDLSNESNADGSTKSLGYSISRDNGKTWSPFKVLFEAGRTDPNLLLMPNGDLVMTYAVNQDMINGNGPASYWHGSEAIVSKDNGRTWQVGRKYILDGMEFAHPAKGIDVMIYGHVCSTAMNNGQVLTVAGSIIPSKAPTTHWPTVDYMTKNINMVRWKP